MGGLDGIQVSTSRTLLLGIISSHWVSQHQVHTLVPNLRPHILTGRTFQSTREYHCDPLSAVITPVPRPLIRLRPGNPFREQDSVINLQVQAHTTSKSLLKAYHQLDHACSPPNLPCQPLATPQIEELLCNPNPAIPQVSVAHHLNPQDQHLPWLRTDVWAYSLNLKESKALVLPEESLLKLLPGRPVLWEPAASTAKTAMAKRRNLGSKVTRHFRGLFLFVY